MHSNLRERRERTSRRLNAFLPWILALAACATAGGCNVAPAQSPEPQTTVTPPTAAAAVPEFLPARSETEQRIVAELAKPTSFDFVETPLKDVVEYLKSKHQIEIVIDEKALKENGIGLDVLVTRSLHSVSLASALSLILRNLDLVYFVDDDVLQLTTQDRADSVLVTRTYPVGDVLHGQDYNNLIDAIVTTVRPPSWDEVGGPGSIAEVPASSSLVVSQTHHVHDELMKLLRALRDAKKFAGPMQAK